MNPRLFGIETEYGITREDTDTLDPVVESMELVRAYATDPFQQRWDYQEEDPHHDQRGFRVNGLQQDIEEQQFAEKDAHRPFSFYEMKSDLVLPNGARFYNDHTHPEYSTPECRSLLDLIAHDRAGERIVQRAAERRNQQLGKDTIQLYKNNTDFHGHSYGCHDNYLIARAIPFDDLMKGLLPFLVSRQLIAGAGKVGIEAQESQYQPGQFQLSQRADFMETELSVDTMHNRPILNTRDEPHADRTKYRRLHLILGDANMCEYATALKIGTTRLVLDMISMGKAPLLELENPVLAIKVISRDLDLKAGVPLTSGRTMSGLEILTVYHESAQKCLSGLDEETDWVLREWGDVLEQLQQNRHSLIGRLDWITKQWLLETFVQEERLEWTDPWLASLDLEYHNMNPERGLFFGLEAEGKTRRLCHDQDIEAAIQSGPSDTRGGIRGLCVARFRQDIKAVQWERVQFKGGIFPKVLDMNDLFDPDAVQVVREAIQSASSTASVVQSATTKRS